MIDQAEDREKQANEKIRTLQGEKKDMRQVTLEEKKRTLAKEKELVKANEDLKERTRECESLQEQNEELTRQIREKAKELMEVRKTLKKKERELEKRSAELQELQSKYNRQKTEWLQAVRVLEGKEKQTAQKLEAKLSEISLLDKSIEHLRQEVSTSPDAEGEEDDDSSSTSSSTSTDDLPRISPRQRSTTTTSVKPPPTSPRASASGGGSRMSLAIGRIKNEGASRLRKSLDLRARSKLSPESFVNDPTSAEGKGSGSGIGGIGGGGGGGSGIGVSGSGSGSGIGSGSGGVEEGGEKITSARSMRDVTAALRVNSSGGVANRKDKKIGRSNKSMPDINKAEIQKATAMSTSSSYATTDLKTAVAEESEYLANLRLMHKVFFYSVSYVILLLLFSVSIIIMIIVLS